MFNPTKFPCKAYHACLELSEAAVGVYTVNIVGQIAPGFLADEFGQSQPARELHETEELALQWFLHQVRRTASDPSTSAGAAITLVQIDAAVCGRITILRAMSPSIGFQK